MRQFFGKSRDQAKAANVGFPLTPCTAYAVRNVANSDEADKAQWELVPRYGVGELALGGAQVAKGYLKNEAKTTKAFIQGGPGINERIYLTGDMVRLNDHGFEFLGRNDDLVKITGIRIELSEISAACAAVKEDEPAIEHVETLYLPRPDGDGGDCNYKVVVTFVSVKQGSADLGKIRSMIFKKAKDLLPTYMVPGHVAVLNTTMPRTASNKVDRKALQSIYASSDLDSLTERDSAATDGPSSKTQWSEHQLPVIKTITKSFKVPIENLSPEDSLAGLGFSSLQVTKLAWALRRQIQCNVSVIDLMQCQTLGELVNAVQKSMETTQSLELTTSPAAEVSWVASVKENLTKCLHGELRPKNTSYILPATPFQESLLVETMIDPGAYWSHRIFDLGHLGQVDASRLKNAWTAAASRLDILRTVFSPLSEFSVLDNSNANIGQWASGKGISASMLQIVIDEPRLRWVTLHDGDAESLAALAEQVQMDWAPLAAKSSQPPWAVSFLEGNNKMMLSMHHSLHDGTSSSMLLELVAKLYDNPDVISSTANTSLQMSRGVELGLLPSITQREEALSKWTSHIEGLVATEGALNAPFPDLTGSRKQGKGIVSSKATIPDFLFDSTGSPGLPQLLQSAFGCVLADILELKAVVLGQTVSQRVLHPDLLRVVGPAMATLPVAVRTHASDAKHLWAEMSRNSLSLGRTAHSLHPVDIKKLVNMGSDHTKAPFPALFVYHPAPSDQTDGINSCANMFRETGHALSLNVEHPLALNVFEADNTIELSGNSRFISQPMLKLLLDQIIDQARAMLEHPEAPLDQLRNYMNVELFSRVGRNETLVGTEIAENPASLVTRWATEHPTWIATEEIFFEDNDNGDEQINTQSLTYLQLEELVNAIASKLTTHEANLRPDDVVALYLRRDLKSLAAILAIFKCNYIYLPIDADLPATRKQFLVQDADAKLVLTTESLIGDLNLSPEKGPPALLLPEGHDELEVIESWPKNPLRNDCESGDGGYLLYTSGSTGRPKGVRVSNRNLLHFISAMTQRLTEANSDTAILGGVGKYLNVASRTFDTHLTSMFAPWHLGFCSAISKDRNDIFANLQQVINKVKITHMGSVPSVIVQLGLRLEDIPSMRVLTIGGEKASHELFDQLNEGNHNTVLMNFYGPTEVTVGCFAHKVGDHSNARNLGLPLRGLEAILLVPGQDEQMIARRGQPGELCLAGPQVSIGYMNRPEENAKSFLYTSLLGGGERRIYRTGDIMRMLHDGTVEFLGRKDQQTKIRGQRFEIDEVVSFVKKTVADQGPLDVAAAVVDQRLIGFLARKPSTLLKAELDSEPEWIPYQSQTLQTLLTAVEKTCQEALPAFMVPEMLWVSRIPYLAASGKIDSKSLINLANESSRAQKYPQHRTILTTEPIASLSPSELEVVAALEEVMGKKLTATSTQSMNSLGVDSLSGVHLMSVLKKKGCANVNLVDLLSPACTVGSVARTARVDVPSDKKLESETRGRSESMKELNLDDIGLSANRLNRANISAVLPCLPLQSSLVALSLNCLASNEEISDADVPYVTDFIYELAPGTDIARWEDIAENTIAAEAILRTCFIQREQDGQIFQVVLKSAPSPLHGQNDATSLVAQMDSRPPIRLRVEEKASGQFIVSLKVHHALYDGSAIATLRNKLEQAYAGRYEAANFGNQSLSDLKDLSNYCHLDEEQTQSVRASWQDKFRHVQSCLVGANTLQANPDALVRLTRDLAYTTSELRTKLQNGNSVSMSTAFQLATALCIAHLTRGNSVVYGFTTSLRPILTHIVDEIDTFFGPCLNTVVHPLQLDSATETLPHLVGRIQKIHEEVSEDKMPLITADKIQRWTAMEEKLFDSILTINVVPQSHDSVNSHSAPGQMTPLPGKSKTDLALAVDVDLHADGKIGLSLSSAGALSDAQLGSMAILFERIIESSVDNSAMVGQFAAINHGAIGKVLNNSPNILPPPPNPHETDDYFDEALTSVQSAACQLLRLDRATITAKAPETTSLYQLGLDSLNIFPFVKAINNSEGIKIVPNAAIRARNVQGVATLVAQAKRERDTIKNKGTNGQVLTQSSVSSQSPYEHTLQQLAGDLLYIATPLQEGMLSASMAIEDQAYTFTHSMQLSRIAREKETPAFDRFFAAVKDTVQDCETLRSRFIFTQNDQAPWVGVVSPIDQSDLVNWSVTESGIIQLKIHHSLYDASSIQAIWRLLNKNYEQRLTNQQDDRPDQERVTYAYRPFARSCAIAQKDAVSFWMKTVEDYKYKPIEFQNEESYASSVSFIDFDASELSNLQAKCRTASVTLKVALQLAWAKVLCETLHEQPDVVFGEVVATGSDDNDDIIMGPTINTVPMRVELSHQLSAISIADALSRLQTLSDSARGANGMASLRAIQTLWRSSKADNFTTAAGLFQSLFVFDGVIDSKEADSQQDLIVPVQANAVVEERRHAYDDYPFIVSFRIKDGKLKGKVRSKTSQKETQDLARDLGAALQYIISEELRSPVLGPSHLHLTDGSWLKVLQSPLNGLDGQDQVPVIRGSTAKADAVIRIAKQVVGDNIRGEIRFDTKLVNVGLDSISAIRFSRALKKQLGIQASVFEIIRGASAQDIANKSTSVQSNGVKKEVKSFSPQDLQRRKLVATALDVGEDHIESIMPTLAGQRWTLQQWLKCGKRFFQAPRAYLIYDDSIDIKKAANCWSELCRAHDVLRTTFVSISDSPLMQVTLDEKFTVAQSLKVVQDNTSTIADLIEKHVREDNKNPSDLKKPPVHLSFLEACDGKAVILRVHHALYDSWNVKMILKDLFSLFAGGSTSQYPPLQRSVQEIISIRQPEAETNYWKQYLSKAQDTIVYSGLGANSNKNTMRPHFKITTDTSSQDISNALSNSISSKSHTSAAIIIAYARALGQLTGRSQPTFGFNHSSRSLESPNGESSIDLTGMSIPTMTVTPLTVDIGTPSRQESFEAVQGHLAQLTRFAQADNLDTLAPKSNSTINIIYPEENGNGHINGTEKTQPLQRYKLDEPLATDYFTNTTPSSIASTVDGLDTSHIHDEQLYFNVLVFPDGKLKVNVSGDEELLRGDKDLVAKLVNNFVTELSGLIQK
jgi:amino acid adenylation domain-containing protein